jgi:hypothetical protein
MKQTSLFFFASVVLFGCTSGPKQDEAKTDSPAVKETYTYPFTARYSLNWKPGDEKNAVLVLNSFKKFVDGDVKGSFDSFADSVEFIADKYHFKGTKDSLMAIMIPMRAYFASITIQPDTWLTTYYPDKKDTWVTIWYNQTLTDKKGKTDSVYITDDVLVKDGKIAQIDEKQRKFPDAPKKK